MKRLIVVLALISMGTTLVAQQNSSDLYIPGATNTIQPLSEPPGQYLPNKAPGDPVLFDNGPLVTHPGGGYGGADASFVQISIGLLAYGSGNMVSLNYWVADDFTVPAGGWIIEGYGFYGYQVSSGLISTMTAVHIIIYDGVPGAVGTNIIFGDEATNRLTSSSFTNIYRVNENSMLSTTRPIMLNDCKFDLFLAPGTYWVAWQTDGTLPSGPWVPLISIPDQTTTGNGMQYTPTWVSIYSGLYQQGLAFLIYGHNPGPSEVPVSNWALIIGFALIGITIFVRFRRLI
jgi:hypothetical protein